MKDAYTTFEFPFIKEGLKKYAYTELARKYCDDLVMFDDASTLEESLRVLKEGMTYCDKYARFQIYNHNDLTSNFINLEKGGIGSKEFFYQVRYLLENISVLKQEFKEKEAFPLLNEYVEQLKPLEMVKNKIDRVISPSLDILDSASANLYRIRNKILRLESSMGSLSKQLVDKYANYLSEGHGAFKNGIFTLMVKSTYKNRVQGIVHAISDTGLTIFIEPQEMIEVHNQIVSLKEEEFQEIQVILKELSTFVCQYIEDLYLNHSIIAELDFIMAKATYASTYRGQIARISQTKSIILKGAAHSMIPLDKVVRNDFIIDKEKMMIITGPNAGGKTVALKVVGLCVLMHQCGLAIPTTIQGELPFFQNVYADIGDHQSVIDNLSTFSSHMVHIEEILKLAKANSLVIIDELGSGTSPLDGEALGLGVIDYLIKKDCFALITSHYEAIKTYALENTNILCASMIFDEKNICPTYRIMLHVASPSYGIEMAYRLGIEEEVISRAKKYMQERKLSDKEIKLEMLNQQLQEVEKLKNEIQTQKELLINKEKELEVEKQKLKNLHDKVKEEAQVEKEKLIEEAKIEIDQIFATFKNQENIKLHQVIEAKHQLDQKGAIEEEIEEETEIVSIGDTVEITSSKVRGKVIRMDKNTATIQTDLGLTIQTKLKGLRKIEQIKPHKAKVFTPDLVLSMKNVPIECNVIGMTVKEALEVIDKYLDDCVSLHYKQVRLIHGSGTGRLRSGIHEYLKKSPLVAGFRLGGGGEGGVGATVVTLK